MVAVDQSTLGTNAAIADGSIVLTTTAVVASGGFIVVYIGWWQSGITLTGVAGGGLAWTVDKQRVALTNMRIAIVSAPAPSGLASSTAITASFTAGGDLKMIAGSSFTGVGLVDTTSDGTAASSATWTSGSPTIQNGSLLTGTAWMAAWAADANTQTAGIETHDWGIGTDGQAAGYRIEATGGAFNVGGTWDTTADTVGIGVAYLAAAAASSPTPPQLGGRGAGW